MKTLGRRWKHSDRRDRAVDQARKDYETLIAHSPEKSAVDALAAAIVLATYKRLAHLTDTWDFELHGDILVASRRGRAVWRRRAR